MNRTVMITMAAPEGGFREQAERVLVKLKGFIQNQGEPLRLVTTTIFLKNGEDQELCKALFVEHLGLESPVMNIVLQPPCNGARLAVEAWAISMADCTIQRHSPNTVSILHDDVRWIYSAGIQSDRPDQNEFEQTKLILSKMEEELAAAGATFKEVVRTWFYLGGITKSHSDLTNYAGFNRARSKYYDSIEFGVAVPGSQQRHFPFPASTGIGISGDGLCSGLVAFQSARDDVRLVAIENPLQTPAYSYELEDKLERPKFSRAVGIAVGDNLTLLISGTASIIKSHSCHLDCIEKQTEQTILNIQNLAAGANLKAHGLHFDGISLNQMAKIRVYIKNPEHYTVCKKLCEQHFGSVPATYSVAEVCRPELLVEIEAVGFSTKMR